MDYEQVRQGFQLLLEGLGADVKHPQLRKTAECAARAWMESVCAGLAAPLAEINAFAFNEDAAKEDRETEQLIVLNGIPVRSLCAHHLLPFFGEASVAYVPAQRLCSLGTLARVVDHHARRPQLQETLTQEIARTLEQQLHPLGVGVAIRATHCCSTFRNAPHGSALSTSVMLGCLRHDAQLRNEFTVRSAL